LKNLHLWFQSVSSLWSVNPNDKQNIHVMTFHIALYETTWGVMFYYQKLWKWKGVGTTNSGEQSYSTRRTYSKRFGAIGWEFMMVGYFSISAVSFAVYMILGNECQHCCWLNKPNQINLEIITIRILLTLYPFLLRHPQLEGQSSCSKKFLVHGSFVFWLSFSA
jgi:hypothetical protein